VWAHLKGPEAARRVAEGYFVEHGRRIQVHRFARVFLRCSVVWRGGAVCGLDGIGGRCLHVVAVGGFVVGVAVCRF